VREQSENKRNDNSSWTLHHITSAMCVHAEAAAGCTMFADSIDFREMSDDDEKPAPISPSSPVWRKTECVSESGKCECVCGGSETERKVHPVDRHSLLLSHSVCRSV
jgi:hypothetical protein